MTNDTLDTLRAQLKAAQATEIAMATAIAEATQKQRQARKDITSLGKRIRYLESMSPGR